MNKLSSFVTAAVAGLVTLSLSACLETGMTYCEADAKPYDCMENYECVPNSDLVESGISEDDVGNTLKNSSVEGVCLRPCNRNANDSKCSQGYTCTIIGNADPKPYCVKVKDTTN